MTYLWFILGFFVLCHAMRECHCKDDEEEVLSIDDWIIEEKK
jgi:hypothetical protein